MEDMEEVNQPVDQLMDMIPEEEPLEQTEDLSIQILYLTNNLVLVSKIKEVIAEIGQPDCMLEDPCVIKDGKIIKWLSNVTESLQMFISSDKILTLVDPNQKILDDSNRSSSRSDGGGTTNPSVNLNESNDSDISD